MTEQHATPAPVRGLRLVQGGTEGDTNVSAGGGTRGDTAAPGTGVTPPAGIAQGGTVSLPVPGAEVVPLSIPERSSAALRQWAESAADRTRPLLLPYARFCVALCQPESIADHRAHVKSRAWVPEELDGNARKALVFLGVSYHLIIGRPLKIAARIVAGAARIVERSADRPLRLAGLIAFLVVFAVFVLPHIHLPI